MHVIVRVLVGLVAPEIGRERLEVGDRAGVVEVDLGPERHAFGLEDPVEL
ncbi:MAG TPA: hypothetical protein VL980_06175 [Gemmatimonadaceae bacterium]|nr:hypothetical protein [Gemmatimonadaceae bacterium]